MESTSQGNTEQDREDWTPERRTLWKRIAAHPFEPDGQVLPFVRRLARDRGWTLEYARGAVEEYRRFCFLAATGNQPMTPSEEVDEVWHQHLTYTRDYWDRWCGHALQAPLHHDPTQGGPAEQARYRAQYAETLARYEAFFGPPGEQYWPATRVRFGIPRFRIVDRNRTFVLPWPPRMRDLLARGGAVLNLLGGLLTLAPGSAAAAELAGNPLDWPAEPFLTLYAALAAAAVLGAVLLRSNLRGVACPGMAGRLGALELAYLAGGAGRVADTAVVGLLSVGAAELDLRGSRVFVNDGAGRLPEELAAFRRLQSGPMTRDAVRSWAGDEVKRIREGLARRGLAPTHRQFQRLALLTAGLVAPVMLLGIAKVFVGAARGKPVGFLLFLLLATGLAALWLVLQQPDRTRDGSRVLAQEAERHGRAARAPRDSELPLAFALTGALALAGTPYAAYASLARSGGSGSSGGGDGSSGCTSSGGGSSDGGGGGCGGCSA